MQTSYLYLIIAEGKRMHLSSKQFSWGFAEGHGMCSGIKERNEPGMFAEGRSRRASAEANHGHGIAFSYHRNRYFWNNMERYLMVVNTVLLKDTMETDFFFIPPRTNAPEVPAESSKGSGQANPAVCCQLPWSSFEGMKVAHFYGPSNLWLFY